MNAQRCSQRACAASNVAPPVVHDVLRTAGQPLDRVTRSHFEPRFARDFTRVAASQVPQKLAIGAAGDSFEREADAFADSAERPQSAVRHADLSSIRVHNGGQAAHSARAVGARAYTVGNHIVFGAGEYAPQTITGRRLIAHELAHAGQQNDGRIARTLQRSLTVVSPTAAAPNQPSPAAGTAALTNAQLVQQWINQLCGSGGWTVDPATGILGSPSRAAFCDPPAAAATAGAAAAQPGFATSGTPTGCKCLCDATAPGATNIQLHTGDVMVTPGTTAGSTERSDVRTQGQGATLFAQGARTGTHIGVTGREGTGVMGAGATSPRSGSGRSQVLQDPPWLILGHELCGHTLAPSATTFSNSHTQSPSGTASAVDIENRIRREHSTASSSLGIRTGDEQIESPTAADPTRMANARGAHYQVVAGDTLASVAARFGIPTASITSTIFMGEGGRFTSATAPITDTHLFIRGLAYHDVIAGETATSIAATWRVPESSLRRANPSLGTAQPTPGTRLFIPIS